MKKKFFKLGLFFPIYCFLSIGFAFAADPTPQDILASLKAHQDQVKTIEADFVMTVFGINNLRLEQSGTYVYHAPDTVVMEFVTPQPQVIKIKGNESSISINNSPFKTIPANDQQPGMNRDLFQYAFLNQFFLEIDAKNKPAESNLYKVMGYFKNADGSMADAATVLNQKAVEFIYDKNTGLVVQMNFMGNGPMPPIEVKQSYEEKNGCYVPRTVFSRVITPGGAIASAIKLTNKKVEKQ